MKTRNLFGALVVCLLLFVPMAVFARGPSPIISTDDLAGMLGDPEMIIIDIRSPDDYKAGHIPGSINILYGEWAYERGDLIHEMPRDKSLVGLLSSAAIQPDSTVIIYGKTETGGGRVDVTRVAWTLRYAGVQKISVLSGGYDKWAFEKKAISVEKVKPKKKPYQGTFNKNIVVRKGYVQERIGEAIIVDAREPAFFKGQQKLPFVAKAGHIRSAINLGTAQVFSKEGFCCWIYRGNDSLQAMAKAAVGDDQSREIIVYCDNGRFASAWWFILSDVLGYQNVKIYDGSMEEWAKDAKAPMGP